MFFSADLNTVLFFKSKGSIVMVHRVGFAIPTAFRRGALHALQHLLREMTPNVGQDEKKLATKSKVFCPIEKRNRWVLSLYMNI